MLLNVAPGAEGKEWSVEPKWQSRDLKPYFNDYVRYGDAVYGFDGNIFACIDLKTGKRHTQTPRSQLARIIANIEFVAQNGNEFDVRANSFIHEESLRGAATWAARNDYRLRLVDGTFRLVRKKVVLVNNNKPIYTLSFLV